MFDFFMVHWVIFAFVFVFSLFVMIVVSVMLERKRLSRLAARRQQALNNDEVVKDVQV